MKHGQRLKDPWYNKEFVFVVNNKGRRRTAIEVAYVTAVMADRFQAK